MRATISLASHENGVSHARDASLAERVTYFPLVAARSRGSNSSTLLPTRRSAMRVAIVIPARFASSRLPGKPLLRETGKYLIQHVHEQAAKAKCASDVIVATDDERIFAAV